MQTSLKLLNTVGKQITLRNVLTMLTIPTIFTMFKTKMSTLQPLKTIHIHTKRKKKRNNYNNNTAYMAAFSPERG